MKKYNFYILSSLLLSLAIYLFYRTEKTVVNELLGYFINLKDYSSMKVIISKNLQLPKQIIYSLPEGLWVFCVCLLSKDLYFQISKTKFNCSLIALLFPITLEFLQLIHITNGTFDPMDIYFSVFFWLFAFFLIPSPYLKKNIFREYDIRSLSFFFSYAIVYLSDVWTS